MEQKNVITMNTENAQSSETTSSIFIAENPRYNFWKRVMDIVCSLLALIILFIPILIISLIIVIDSPGAPPIYVQERVGKNGRKFKFYKFRSMVPNAEKMLDSLLDKNEMEGPVFKIMKDPRITRFGRIIRKSSVDEIPQFINVLKGDMSLVGPRPPLPREVEMYTEKQKLRLSVIPGMTCYWQIQPQRNSLSFDEWLEWDLKYLSDRSLKTDMKILIKTFGVVCGLEGQ